jgi:hypothetical protein
MDTGPSRRCDDHDHEHYNHSQPLRFGKEQAQAPRIRPLLVPASIDRSGASQRPLAAAHADRAPLARAGGDTAACLISA